MSTPAPSTWALVVLVVLSACAQVQVFGPQGDVVGVARGASTTELLAVAGEPDERRRALGGGEEWIYVALERRRTVIVRVEDDRVVGTRVLEQPGTRW